MCASSMTFPVWIYNTSMGEFLQWNHSHPFLLIFKKQDKRLGLYYLQIRHITPNQMIRFMMRVSFEGSSGVILI